ncbi:hypothetical protein COS69_00575 [Candidatus Kaiserbacteria bacterium CG06_land_8_20_14_3_00_49_31]|uniref:Uncharacterized protein n=1 Tax=Candidatus Kaiserbacteria bacterium CG08_land_8_20_14_0_20_50_21 TaxID=1974604 RepID=A0A2H0YY24_9BACT|nr:MAG: hypothetical protein COT23_02645 [Candidatus Kaiserbacteria bacterium CG08_land_8_20_14_0_20_50_21]PIU82207.1 MAG: hypothetical protein COS69_00575 [Candidatus Kaiserbacteria bacterium CG06_land_8_20_14_3_00_49_31]
MRRALIIIAIILVLLGIGVATYFLFFARTAGIVVAPTGSVSLPVAGQQEVPDIGIVNTSSTTPVIAPVPVSARLVKISAGPVVLGEVLVDIPAKNASSSPDVAINYIERESGNVFSYLTNTKTITRTSNKTIPGIQSASWLPNASLAFVRYLSGTDFSTINTYALPANGVGGFFLPQNLADIAVSSTSVLTLTSGVNGSVASLERTDGTHAISIFSTPLSALRVSFAGKNQYLAYTKPSATLPGYAFLVSGTGRFSPVVGPQNGLVALASPSGKWVLVSYTLVNAMQMTLINTVTGETFPLPVATIADKCAWMADDSVIYCGIPMNPPADIAYPDDWYQGAVHFSDRIWKIQVSGRYAQLVLDFPKETNDDSLDAEAMAINSFGTVLSFVNKNDGSLWGYSL